MRFNMFWILSLFSLFLLSGCGGDDSYETVDFGDTVSRLPVHEEQDVPVLNVAVGAMISPEKTLENYQALIEYIGGEIDRKTRIIQRKTYGEVNELIRNGDVDIAFICTGPYIRGKPEAGFEAIATPVIRGEPFYRAYLIVHRDSSYQSLPDLEGTVFAFTDPASNTGAMVPTSWLAEIGESPDRFFDRVHYTYSHDNSILAVAASLVEGASVDGHIWEYYHQRDPVNTSKTRVIRKSEPFGSPPLVASAFVDDDIKNRIRQTVLHMHETTEGRTILERLMIDRFAAPLEKWYENVPIREKDSATQVKKQ